VAVETLFHRYRFGLFDLPVTIGTLNTLAGVQFALFPVGYFRRICCKGRCDAKTGQNHIQGKD
jgi:hypothetical protein